MILFNLLSTLTYCLKNILIMKEVMEKIKKIAYEILDILQKIYKEQKIFNSVVIF